MKIKKNDTVLVITGKDKNNDLEKASKVIAVLPKENKVVVEGINLQKKHKKARSAQEVSSIQTQPGPIDASNVMVVCPTCKKATRVGYRVEGDKKVRICKKCNAVLDGVKAKEVKKTTKRKTKKDAAETPAEA